jgi:hypothetical protein
MKWDESTKKGNNIEKKSEKEEGRFKSTKIATKKQKQRKEKKARKQRRKN